MTKPDFKGNPVQRLQSFVAAAENASSSRPPPKHGVPAEAKKQEPRRTKRDEAEPRRKKQDKAPAPEVRETESKPRSYADVAKKARPISPPATLCQAHWKGMLVPPDEFVARISNATEGMHLITGVVDTIPAGFDGVMLPERATATIVMLPSTATTFPKAEISAPAACARGNTRIHKLAYVQLGTPTFPLQWKPIAAKASVTIEETCTLRAQMFSRYQKANEWTRIRARPREVLRELILKLPQVNPDDLIDIFDFRRPDNDNQAFFSCTLRVKKHAVPKFVAASGHAGLLLKDFDTASSVLWSKPIENEDGPAFLARVREQSIEEGVPGVAFSASGSIGLRRRKGEIASTYKISGFKCGTARSSVIAFAATHGWREAQVVSTSLRKQWLQVTLKARPPEGDLQPPWSYLLSDGSCITFEPWVPNARTKPFVKLATPSMRVPAENFDKGKSAITPAVRLSQPADPDTDAAMIGIETPAKLRRGADTLTDNLGFTPQENDGQGDCLFASIAQAFKDLGKSPDDPKTVRAQVAAKLLEMESKFSLIFGGVDPQGQPCT